MNIMFIFTLSQWRTEKGRMAVSVAGGGKKYAVKSAGWECVGTSKKRKQQTLSITVFLC
jgi:hypothetical protein